MYGLMFLKLESGAQHFYKRVGSFQSPRELIKYGCLNYGST